MKKLILAILFAALITLGAANAQSVYVSKYNDAIGTDYSVIPASGNHFTLPSGGGNSYLSTRFYGAEWTDWENYWFSTGQTFTQASDFYGEFRIKTPADFQAGTGGAIASFGFTNGASSTPAQYYELKNVFSVYIPAWNQPHPNATMQIMFYDSNGNSGPDVSGGGVTDAIKANTDYIIKMSYTASTKDFKVDVYDLADGSLADTATINIGTKVFSVTSIGVFSGDYMGSLDQFNLPWLIYGVKANEGTTEEGQSIIAQDGDITFEWSSDQSDATQTSKTSLQSVDVKDAQSEYSAVLDLDLSAASLDIALPSLTTDFDGTQFKTFLHPATPWAIWNALPPNAGVWQDDWIYVPINTGAGYTLAGVYRCPDATQISDISEACGGYEIPSEKTETQMNGVLVGKIPNQGGGSGGEGGGSSVPEFSDIAYVLAAVLGAGGFILVRKYKHF
ncbi:MAG: hypothetical protein PHC66_00835 [Candidatus Nanoarchaeia archaeon]|nr:hypothetical protein [Candidatus Nanoarchaeia archaeon]MDD5239247.1 hypothetical protein [Candidatus Nanoarchaeia archaeon]